MVVNNASLAEELKAVACIYAVVIEASVVELSLKLPDVNPVEAVPVAYVQESIVGSEI